LTSKDDKELDDVINMQVTLRVIELVWEALEPSIYEALKEQPIRKPTRREWKETIER
jgi:hypothetical protein